MYRIAIMGRANTGKNTLSKMLVKQIRDTTDVGAYARAHYIAFADPIKEMIGTMFPKTPKKYLYGSSKYRNEIIPGAFKEGIPLTVRQLLMDLGTEVGRKYMPNIWLDNFDHRFEQVRYCSIIVVTDVRFRNEFDHLRKKGFYMIRLYRDTVGQSKIDHISETGQEFIKDEEFDYVLFNNNPLKDLKNEVLNKIVPNLHND